MYASHTVREQLSIFGQKSNPNGRRRKLLSLDLFCGAGGISEGLRQAGFSTVFANDFDTKALSTFKRNHPQVETSPSPIEELTPRSIRKGLGLAQGELDCLAGGPPCQGFSINAPERFLEDPRNSLFTHYFRFVDEFRPKTILFENVPGMLSLGDGHIVNQILDELVRRGYDVNLRILLAAHYGVPQQRWRLIILASNAGLAPDHPIPTHKASARANFRGGRRLTFRPEQLVDEHLLPHVSVQDAIGDLPPLEPGQGSEDMAYSSPPNSAFSGAMRIGADRVANHFAPRIAKINLERLKHIGPGGSWRDLPTDLLPEGMKQARTSDHTRRYGRLEAGGLSGTVMTKMDPHWGPAFHYEQARTLTVREAARLQSFPDRYEFLGARVSQYQQVGNAVPVLMARAIGCEIAKNVSHRISGPITTYA